MIIGVGTDIVDSYRINKILNKHNEKFIKRVFGSNEIALFAKWHIPFSRCVACGRRARDEGESIQTLPTLASMIVRSGAI